jgi:hypothetical protein
LSEAGFSPRETRDYRQCSEEWNADLEPRNDAGEVCVLHELERSAAVYTLGALTGDGTIAMGAAGPTLTRLAVQVCHVDELKA